MEQQNLPIDSQVQGNAVLTYFFLSGFVLLSKSQNFAHPFIRAHAKYAFLFHAAVVVLIASLVFTRTLYDLDVLGISLKHIVYTALFIGCLAGMIHGMYRASRGMRPSLKMFGETMHIHRPSGSEHLQSNLDETQSMTVIMSYIPYIGILLASRHREIPEVSLGARVGTSWMLLVVLIGFLSHPGQNTLAIGLLLVYVVVIVLRAMMLFFPSSDDDAGVELPFSLPSWQTVYSFFQAVPRYIQLLLQTIGGSNVRLDLRALMLQAQQQDASRQTQYVHTHQDYDHVFSPWMTYLPILNLIYIPRLFTRKDNIYYLAIGQGVALSALSILIWGQSMESWWMWLLLFPFFLGLANVTKTPGYRVPVAYEIVQLVKVFIGFLPSKTIKEESTKELRNEQN